MKCADCEEELTEADKELHLKNSDNNPICYDCWARFI